MSIAATGLGDVQAETSIEINEGVYGMVNRQWPVAGNEMVEGGEPVALTLRGDGAFTLVAIDTMTGDIAWQRELQLAPGAPAAVEVEPRFGVNRLELRGRDDGQAATVRYLAVIPPFHPGIRQDSFFGSNTSNVRRGRELELLQAIGMKVQRAHFQNMTRERLEEQRRHDTWVLPIVGYAQPLELSDWAKRMRQHGPPADFQAFVEFWREMLERFPDIETWEFWNEPWIFEWTWADTPSEYRRLQRLWSEMALQQNPDRRIIAGNSWMFVQDHLELYPYSWQGLLQGTTHHPYSGAGALSFRPGESLRSIDAGHLVNQRMGLDYYYLTEGGTNVGTQAHGGSVEHYQTPNNIVNARKLVHLFVNSALSGAFQGNVQWGLGYGPEWTMSNASFAVMTHLLEDRPVVAEIWPRQELLRGAVFAHPRHIDHEVRNLPRADQLQARWQVEPPASRADDTTKVAVVWSWTGDHNRDIDRDGTLTLENPADIRAYDLFGRRIPARPDGTLVVPFNNDPVYLVSDQLSVVELRRLVADARLENLTPANLYLMPLRQAADQPQELLVRIHNQMNLPVRGELRLAVPGHGIVSRDYAAAAGQLTDLAVAWPGVPVAADNRYPAAVRLEVECEDGRALGVVEHSQVLQSARFIRRTIEVDGESADWEGVTPIEVAARPQVDFTRFLLNPHLDPPTMEEEKEGRRFRVYTAYDDDYVYVAVAGLGVNTQIGERVFEDLPWKKGHPAGLRFAQYMADNVQLAFGFRERVPGYGRQIDDPWVWKGHFYDTDYLYIVHPTTDAGDQVVRQWGPDTDRRTAYQTVEVPHVQIVPGARAALREGFWEIAIPRQELAMFDPAAGDLRFGVLINGSYNWADTAGVFDYWRGSGSFNPAWEFRTPAQTRHGIER